MQVILLNDVAKIGRKLEVHNVADGYATNFLFPKKLAERATPKRVKELEEQQKAAEAERALQSELLHKNLESLKGSHIELSRKANEQGHLYKGVSKEDVYEAIKADGRLELGSPEVILLDQPIKALGEHTIRVRVGEQEGEFVLNVISA